MTRCLAWLACGLLPGSMLLAADPPPNVVIIFCDDAGYADIGPFGAEGYQTPNLDRMAREGRVFTDFYAAQAVCSASRAALLTGCYPNRVGIQRRTRPELKNRHQPRRDHPRRGPQAPGLRHRHLRQVAPRRRPPVPPHPPRLRRVLRPPLLQRHVAQPPHQPLASPTSPSSSGTSVVERNPDQSKLTTWYTEHAVRFIDKNHDRPFFLYLPHSMPHVPLLRLRKIRGQAQAGASTATS